MIFFTVCISTCICNIGVTWLYWENVFKLLKKIYTVSNEFSVYGSMLYIFKKKTINMCFMDRHFILSKLYFLFLLY